MALPPSAAAHYFPALRRGEAAVRLGTSLALETFRCQFTSALQAGQGNPGNPAPSSRPRPAKRCRSENP